MVVLHVLSNDKKQVDEIAQLLVKEKLILSAVIQENLNSIQRGKEGEIVNKNQILITGKTKALLFNSIDKLLREKYPLTMPELYSIPIVSMDWKQADQLINETAKV